ncbi:MAG TPA: phosphatidate cytidylyltransferase [Syntrophorhabdaceae bacterium]|nr:phosphatidate cytidylyltransferase [Syntrophorhabdaceae bacterium]
MGELKKRVIAGLCLGPFIVGVFYFLPVDLFYVFLAIVSLLATIEATGIAMVKEKALIGMLSLMSSIPLYSGYYGIFVMWIVCSVFIYFIAKALVLKNYESGVYGDIVKGMIVVMMSEVFIVIPLIYFCLLKKLNVHFPLVALFSIWSSDTLAYLLGKGFGKRPLVAHLSPKKTLEGLFGAVLGSVIVVLLTIKLTGFGIFESICVGGILGLLGQGGDIFESTWKRLCGVKDSSSLIPGHGGILDRIDSFIFTTPFLYHYIAGFKL